MKSLEPSRNLSPPTKQTTILASSRLTRSEIDSLKQGKKLISDYALKELSKKISSALKPEHLLSELAVYSIEDNLPSDLAEQHDHYLYGVKKTGKG